jgi:hypothetical protein
MDGVAGIIVCVFVGLLGGLVLWNILTGSIKLEKLISEANGDASMARLQLLIFTFVIAMSLFLIIAYKKDFPTIPTEILGLLGISAGSYVIGKGIQFSKTEGITGIVPSVVVATPTVTLQTGQSQQFTATVACLADQSVRWSINPPAPGGGTITPDGLYTAPTTAPTPPTVTVMVTSVADPKLSSSIAIQLS